MKNFIYIAITLLLSATFASCDKEDSSVKKNPLAGTVWEYVVEADGRTYEKELNFRNDKEGSYYTKWMSTTEHVGSSSSYFFDYEITGNSIYIKLDTPAESLSGTFTTDKMELSDHYGSYTFKKKK